MSGGLRWKKSDNITGDIVCTEPGFDFPISIEIKFHEEINLLYLLMPEFASKNKVVIFWDQAKKDGLRGNKLPLLMFRKNQMKKDFYVCVMPRAFYTKLKKSEIFPKGFRTLEVMLTSDMALMRSDQLFTVPFLPFRKMVKKYLKNPNFKVTPILT